MVAPAHLFPPPGVACLAKSYYDFCRPPCPATGPALSPQQPASVHAQPAASVTRALLWRWASARCTLTVAATVGPLSFWTPWCCLQPPNMCVSWAWTPVRVPPSSCAAHSGGLGVAMSCATGHCALQRPPPEYLQWDKPRVSGHGQEVLARTC